MTDVVSMKVAENTDQAFYDCFQLLLRLNCHFRKIWKWIVFSDEETKSLMAIEKDFFVCTY